MTMIFVKANDANGVELDALTNNNAEQDAEGRRPVWIFTDKTSGFGDTVGQINLHQLKLAEDGPYAGQYVA